MKTIKEIVLQDQKDKAKEGHTSYLQEVVEHGCSSGIVNDLIYYVDTTKFFKKHEDEINELIVEAMDGTGESMEGIFGDKFDKEDPLCFGELNQNLLAWFAYEETARKVLEEQGIEV